MIVFTWNMFVRHETKLDLDFGVAQARLANLAGSGSLLLAAQHAYGDGTTGLTRVGPLGSVRGMSKLVQVRFQELVTRADSAHLALRWEATGPGGVLFPALDADFTLTPGDEQTAVLELAGVYRPPAGIAGAKLDQAVLSRVAEATIRAFVGRVAEFITDPARAAAPTAPVTGPSLSWRTRASEMP
ncbi:MAG TPA: hypothetical protein VH480_19965 [Streptosporangiaceae bacterium]